MTVYQGSIQNASRSDCDRFAALLIAHESNQQLCWYLSCLWQSEHEGISLVQVISFTIILSASVYLLHLVFSCVGANNK